ncbi:MAG: extracellular solute-binding protein [Hyphomicrobiaceae bacterium]
MNITRRRFLEVGATAAAAMALPATLGAQSKEVYYVTYPGSVDEAFKKVVGPAFIRNSGGINAIFTPMLNIDLIGKIKAAQANPPFDVAMFDDGPLLTAIKDGLVERFDTSGIKAITDVPENLRNRSGYGPVVSLTAVGIAYNPRKIPTPPTSWSDLWDPKYKGRVGIVGPASTLGTTFLVEIAKLNGGSEINVEEGFKVYKTLIPNLGAVGPSPGGLVTMFQQGQVDIGPQFFNNVAAMKSRGGDIAFAVPKEGLALQTITVCQIANAKNKAAGRSLIETIFSVDVQQGLEAEPYVMLPTNAKVKLSGQNAALAADVSALLAKGKFLDWTKFVDLRPSWIDRFNRDVKL